MPDLDLILLVPINLTKVSLFIVCLSFFSFFLLLLSSSRAFCIRRCFFKVKAGIGEMPVHVSLCRRWVSSFYFFSFFCWKNTPKNYIALTLINPTNSNHLRAYHLFLSCSSVQQWSRLNPLPSSLAFFVWCIWMWWCGFALQRRNSSRLATWSVSNSSSWRGRKKSWSSYPWKEQSAI